MDVVIANANVKANEASVAFAMAHSILKPTGGTMVLVDHTERGQVIHRYGGAFGYHIGGKSYRGIRNRFTDVKKVIFHTPYPYYSGIITFGDPRAITPAEAWEKVMEDPAEYGSGTRAAVLLEGTIMTFRLPKYARRKTADSAFRSPRFFQNAAKALQGILRRKIRICFCSSSAEAKKPEVNKASSPSSLFGRKCTARAT